MSKIELANGRILHTHDPGECLGPFCSIHRPSDHPLRNEPFVWRPDRFGLLERLCVHGIGHPDPDSLAYIRSQGVEESGVHGCDGCCARPPA
jgi:hypothetical protein